MYQVNEKLRVWGDFNTFEPQAINQLYNVAKMDVVDCIAVMPDCHFGKGATVGSVIASKKAVIPGAVGVDLGCGMAALKTNLKASDLPDSLSLLRSKIEANVPVGFNQHKGTRDVIKYHNNTIRNFYEVIMGRYKKLNCYDKLKYHDKVEVQLGTLGGGNHFIELCLDQNDDVWLMLHSGSRNIGKVIADIHINIAKELLDHRGITLPDRDLAWLSVGTPEFKAYYSDVKWAQGYAHMNRAIMLNNIKGLLEIEFPQIKFTEEAISCHHNYIEMDKETYITRKGAVSAREGELGIIPGSMGTKSYIVRGKGNELAFHSCSHGAGRRMSRGDAKRKFTIADLEEQTKGVECRKDHGILDEIPSSYKNIDEVMEAQKDLVDIMYTLKAVMCIKG